MTNITTPAYGNVWSASYSQVTEMIGQLGRIRHHVSTKWIRKWRVRFPPIHNDITAPVPVNAQNHRKIIIRKESEVFTMLRNIINNYNVTSDNLIKTALDMATQDIKANRLAFGKRTTLSEAMQIIELCLVTATKVETELYQL
jgi:hypothetical protein